MGNTKKLLATGAGLASLFSAHGALAQTVDDAPGYSTEIIVTAQKREENLQDVPIAISVLSGEQLDALNISNVDQLKLVTPSFESNPFGLSIRGVGTATFSTSIEPTVSTVVDGVVLGRPEMALGSFYDIERVEVLRGPQGMLFGKNASSGLVNITTVAPQLGEFQARGDLSFGGDGYRRSNATLNIPVGDTFALRAGVYSNQVDGALHNFDGRDANGNEESGARVRGLWRASENVDVLITGDYLTQQAAYVWAPYRTEPGGDMEAALAACGIVASPTNRETCIDGPSERDLESYGLTAQIDWDLGDFTLTSITSGRREFLHNNTDSDSTTAATLNQNINDQDIRQLSQELRITSPAGERIEYVAGLYYFQMRTEQRTDQAGALGSLNFTSIVDSLVDTQSTALFGQASYHATDALTLIAGGRVTHDEIEMDFHQFSLAGTIGVLPTVLRSDEVEETNFSWRVGAEYQITPDVMAYATISRGYKGPGFNQTAVANATTPQVVGPETPESYEIGLKTSFFDGAITANIALFDTTFVDYQAQVLDPSVTPAVFRTVNGGDLETRGVEADVTAILPPGIIVNAAVAYLDAAYGTFLPISCVTGTAGCPTGEIDRSGQPLAGAAEWKATLNAYYEHDLTEFANGFIQADYSWRSDVNASATGDPITHIDAYGLVGASIGLAAKDDSWRFSLWGRNLTDENFPSALFNTPFGESGDYSYVPTSDAERRFGFALSVRR